MILNEKIYGHVKYRIDYNSKVLEDWITKDDKSSLTMITNIIKLLAVVDAVEGNDIVSIDTPNASFRPACLNMMMVGV